MRPSTSARRFSLWSLMICILALVASALGCSDSAPASPAPLVPGPPGAVHEATLAPGAIYLDEEGGFTVREMTEGAVTVDLADGVDVPAVGTVVVITHGTGSVRRVKGVTGGERRYVLSTEPAALHDAFSTLNMDFAIVLDADGIEGDQTLSLQTTASPLANKQSALDAGKHIVHDLGGTVLYDSGAVKVEVVSGKLEVWASLAAQFNLIADSDVVYDLDVSSSAAIKITLSGSASLEGQIPVPGAAWYAVMRLGKLTTKLKLGMFAGYSISADAALSLTSTYSYAERISGHLTYSTITGACSGVVPTRSHSHSQSDPVIEGEANAEAKVYLRPLVEMEVFDVKGVDLSVEAFARLRADYHFTSGLGSSWGWLFDLGAGVHLSTFPDWAGSPAAYDYSGEAVLWDWEQQRRLVFGHVLGNPAGVSLTLKGEATDDPPGPYERTAIPDSSGLYVFDQVPKGHGTVEPKHAIEIFDPTSFDVTIEDSDLGDRDVEILLIIEPELPLRAAVGSPFAHQFKAHGGKGTGLYTWTITGLPPGFTWDAASGAVSGVPGEESTAGSPYTVKVHVEDDASPPSESDLTVTLMVASILIQSSTLPSATEGQPYFHALTALNGSGNYTWSASGLPAGLSIDSSTGEISGTPDAGTGGSPSTYTVEVQVHDDDTPPATGQVTTTLSVWAGQHLEFDPATTGPLYPTANGWWSHVVYLIGMGEPPYTWTVTGLPPGLTAEDFGADDCAFYGDVDPSTINQSFSVQVQVQDSGMPPLSVETTIEMYVNAFTPIWSYWVGPVVPEWYAGQYNEVELGHNSVNQPVTWSVIGGSLPGGVSIWGSVVLGAPEGATVYGTHQALLEAIDATGGRARLPLQYRVLAATAPPLTVSANSFAYPEGAYLEEPLGATGGSGSYSFIVVGLPPGLVAGVPGQWLSGPTQKISGAADDGAAGSYPLTIYVRDNNGSGGGKTEVTATISAP